jgi:hypothetical protein
MTRRHDPAGAARGQTLVIFALALVAMLSMVALVIDAGNAFAQQRRTQNGMDASAEAGAVELARRLIGLPGNDAQWDQRVLDAVNNTAAANDITTVETPQYVDFDGVAVGPVGTGSIPAGTRGVHAGGSRDFNTFVAGLIGLGTFTASAEATAITGYAEDSGVGGLLPVTFPIILTQCETGGGSNRLYHPLGNAEWPVGPNNVVAIPLCSNGPGNVGWIDWDPPAGGASDIAASILGRDNVTVTTPGWYFVAQTGQITSLDNEMDFWENKPVTIPIFHAEADDPSTPQDESILGTCDTEPGGDKDELSDCPPGHNGGNGQNQWYFFTTFAQFHLLHSYIAQNHEDECNDPSLVSIASSDPDSNQLLNNCLIGYFKAPVVAANMTVGSGTNPVSSLTPLAIQLIR